MRLVSIARSAIALLLGTAITRGAEPVALQITREADSIQARWTSESVTPAEPFIHRRFIVERSSDLLDWETSGAPVDGGLLGVASRTHLIDLTPESTETTFLRLVYRLDLSDQDLSGVRLAGADLSGADLTGTDLTGANLSGADFTGATLAGAKLDGATLAGARLQKLAEPLFLTGIGGDPAAEVAAMTPYLQYRFQPEDYPLELIEAGERSPTIVSAMPTQGATVQQINQQLASAGARIVGSIPGAAGQVRTILTLKLPTTSETVDAAVATLKGSGVFDVVVRDGVDEPAALPREVQLLPHWEWTDPSGQGNWGFELMGVPQLWNLTEAIEKRNAPPIVVGVIDTGFDPGHPEVPVELDFTGPLDVTVGAVNIGHGTHVAGTIGASHVDGGGIQGISPFVRMLGETSWGSAPEAWQRDAVWRLAIQSARVINISLGQSWHTRTSPVNPNTNTVEQAAVNATGDLAAELIWGLEFLNGSAPLICVAAGNSSGKTTLGNAIIDSRWSVSWANAASRGLVDTILIIEAIGSAGVYDEVTLASTALAPFSNINGNLSAPGVNIYSASYPNAYDFKQGTSMAAPHVTGLAAYLLAVEPGLDTQTLIQLLEAWATPVGSGISPMPRAWHSAMEIDGIGGGGTKVLEMLLDVDDGSLDGNERIVVPDPEPGRTRAFEQVLTDGGQEVKNEDFDADGGIGNTRIDIGDFRRWRDWLIQYESEDFNLLIPHGLNGESLHPKRDLNRSQPADGVAGVFRISPRGDFNGDGVIERLATQEVPGALGGAEFTDLQVLMESGLWMDEYVETGELPELMDSVDLHVSAEQAFALNPEVSEAGISVIETGPDTQWGKPRPFTTSEPQWIFTVPVGTTFHLESDRIPFGEDSAIVLRSIVEREFEDQEVGGDFTVDLAAVEMTARAELDEADVRIVEARPDEEEADAYLPATGGGFSGPLETIGAEGWANDEASFFCVVRSGEAQGVPLLVGQSRTFRSEVLWRRSFLKNPDGSVPKFKVKPMRLRLVDGLGVASDGEAFHAKAELKLEKRVPGISDWSTVFHTLAEIEGGSFGPNRGHNFELKRHEGDIPQGDFNVIGFVFETRDPDTGEILSSFSVTNEVHYLQEGVEEEIPLDDVPDDGAFELRYTLLAEARDWGPDSFAEAFIADPLDYATAVQLAYGDYGELPLILAVAPDADDSVAVTFRSREGFYYALAHRNPDGSVGTIVDLALGRPGQLTLIDASPPPGADADSYEVLMRRLDRGRDADGDGIDDVYELLHPHFLDPLDPADADLDQDGDGFSNKAEYENDTDPEVPEMPLQGDRLLYPGRLVPLAISGQLYSADLNDDGLPDFLGQGNSGATGPTVAAALANPDGTYQEPVLTVLGATVGLTFTVGHLGPDPFPDLLLDGGGEPLLRVYRGLGNGRFEWVSDIATSRGLAQTRLGDYNGDGVVDALGVSASGKQIFLFAGVGDGSLAAPGVLDFELLPAPQSVTVGQFNDDLWPDLAVCFVTAQVGILYGSAAGAFTEPEMHAVGSSPRNVAAGDINNDGREDIVTANRFSDDVSVLFALPDGGFTDQQRFNTGENPGGLALVDLNDDGGLDLVVSNADSDHHSVLLNDLGGGLLEPVPVYTSTGNGQVLLGDYNSDGALDLAARTFGEQVLILDGDGTGDFASRDQIDIPLGLIQEVQLLNLDGQGGKELLILDQRSSEFQVWAFTPSDLTNVAGAWSLTKIFAVPPAVESFAVADFNLDTFPDLAVLSAEPEFFGSGTNVLTFFLSQPDGTLTNAGGFDTGVAGRMLLSARLNGDSYPDLLVVSPQDDFFTPENEVQILGFLSDGPLSFTAAEPLVPGEAIYAVMPQDLDGDEVDELLVSGFATGQNLVTVHGWDSLAGWMELQNLPTGGGAMRSWQWTPPETGAPPALLAVVDSQGPTPGQVVAFDIVAGALDQPRTLLSDVAANGVAAGDVNGDGIVDLLLGDGIASLHLGDGLGGYLEPEYYWLGNGRSALLLDDLNADNRPDLTSWGGSTPGIPLLYQIAEP